MDSLVKPLLRKWRRLIAHSDVNAILVTHEHSDHIKGIGVLARNAGFQSMPMKKTWQAAAGKLGSRSRTTKSSIPERYVWRS